MTLWERLTVTPRSDNSIVERLIDELAEARKDAVRMAEASATTLDRIVTARYDRPERVATPQRPDRSPMAAQASLDDDVVWLQRAGIVSDPEQ